MTLEFQKNILRYLFQNKTDKIQFINPEIFDTIEFKSLFELLFNYVKDHGKPPDKNNFIEFITKQVHLKTGAINLLKNQLVWVYELLEDKHMVEELLTEEVKKKIFTNIIKESLIGIENGVDSFLIDSIYKKIQGLTLKQSKNDSPAYWLIRDLNKSFVQKKKTIYPTFLKGLNDMTSLGGFYPPQNIIFMKPPKAFGTGFLIKLGAEYMKDGIDVFYADFENGAEEIMMRFKQTLLECALDEIDNFSSQLRQIKQKLTSLTGGGEVVIKKYKKRLDNVSHVEQDFLRALDEGLNPKLIIHDYIDVMGCSDHKKTDPRLIIQHNYAEIENMNDQYNIFSVSVSKMGSAGWSKEWPGPEDIGEDKEKIYNAHAVFALMRNEDDIQDNLGRIIPIVQRMGVSYIKTACYLVIDPEHALIEEVKI